MNKTIKLDQIKVLVTSECNLNCTHCFRSFDKNKYILSYEKVIELIDYAIETTCNSISFSGGEFFTHPNAFQILDYCYDNGIKVKILTNATNIGKLSYYEKYKGTDLISFQISLDGMRHSHDSRRGPGMFDLVVSNAQKLKNLGLLTTVSMTVDYDNMYDIIDVLSLSCFDKHNFVPVAYAGARTKQERPSKSDHYYQEYESIIKTLYRNNEVGNNILERCRIFPHQLGIKYDGSVYPCAVARDYGIFCMGNINERPIKDIVNSFLETEKALELLSYNNNDFEDCFNCVAKEICNRGCRARAYKFFDRLQAPDPFCCKLFDVNYNDIPINCIFWGEQ